MAKALTRPENLCYYVTAREIAGIDARKLAATRDMWQRHGGLSVVELQVLFAAAGLSVGVMALRDIEDVRRAVVAAGLARGGSCERFGLAFVRGDGTGHMVVARYLKGSVRVDYRDYQCERTGADATGDVATATHFFLFI